MKSLEVTIARIGLLASFFVLLACGGMFGGDAEITPHYEVRTMEVRMENRDPSLPVHLWVGSGGMTDGNRVDAGQFHSQIEQLVFPDPSTHIPITVYAERPGMARQHATVLVNLFQASSGNRIVAHWTASGGLVAELVPPNND